MGLKLQAQNELDTIRIQNQSVASEFTAEELESLSRQSADSINPYIEDRKKQFNVKLEVGNDLNTYTLIDEGNRLELSPNLNLRYALVFSYKFLSVRLGIRPKPSSEEIEDKGETNTFRFQIQLLFDNWSHHLEYNRDKGFYVANTEDILLQPNTNKIQFPSLTAQVLFGTSLYKFNPNYSLRAVQSQTERQTKSAGSLMPGIHYNFYQIKGTNKIRIPGQEEIIVRERYNEYNGLNLGLTIGYYYTFVIDKNWYLHAFGAPIAGVDFYKTTTRSPEGLNNSYSNDLYFSIDYGFGGGFNGEKFFFGARWNNRNSNEKFSENKIQIQANSKEFSVFFGYRFKAPKQVSKPVEYIETKVPILKDDGP